MIQMIKMLKTMVAEYDAAINVLIPAITENNDKTAKYMEEMTELKKILAEFHAAIKDSKVALAAALLATQGCKEDKAVKILEKKVAEYVAVTKRLIQAIQKNTDLASDITKSMEVETDLFDNFESVLLFEMYLR